MSGTRNIARLTVAQRDRIDGAMPDGRGHLLGVLAPLGRGAREQQWRRDQGLGGATTAANQASTGLDLGIRHTF